MALPVRKSNESPFEFQFNDAAILDKSTLNEWAKLFNITIQTTSKPKFEKEIRATGVELLTV